jgi:hypothetical protein
MEPRGSSALHYSAVISALDIAGDEGGSSLAALEADEVYDGLVKTATRMVELGLTIEQLEGFRQQVEDRARSSEVDPIVAWPHFLETISAEEREEHAEPDFSQSTILQEEFPVLSDAYGRDGRWLITKPRLLGGRHGLDKLFEKTVQVERLREVRAFRGFQRRNVTENQMVITPSLGRPAPKWLPSIQVLGEGIFLEFSKDAICQWLEDNSETIGEFTRDHLQSADRLRLPHRMGFNATPVFIMIHTFSHLLINQLSFDCGYSSTSLRERIYCGPASNPYAGVLIYTADSDSEGSMGGLVEMGGPDRIADVIFRAVVRSQWCSGDPVCRELESQGVDGLNRAACHACSLVAETSCTYSNILLNRVLVSGAGRLNGRGRREPFGFFNSVLAENP